MEHIIGLEPKFSSLAVTISPQGPPPPPLFQPCMWQISMASCFMSCYIFALWLETTHMNAEIVFFYVYLNPKYNKHWFLECFLCNLLMNCILNIKQHWMRLQKILLSLHWLVFAMALKQVTTIWLSWLVVPCIFIFPMHTSGTNLPVLEKLVQATYDGHRQCR